MTFTGHTILITGGTSGIGLGFAKKFSELGNKVIITARNEKRLNQILNENKEHIFVSKCKDKIKCHENDLKFFLIILFYYIRQKILQIF